LFAGQGALRGGGADAGVSLGAAYLPVRWLAFAMQVDGRASLASTPLDAARSLRTEVFSLAPLVCPELWVGVRVAGELCLGPELVLVWAQGHGFVRDEHARLTRTGVRVLPEIRWRLAARWQFSVAGLLQLGFADSRSAR
jgi:hypothetical protein